jgi:hypothetical protein
MADTIEVRLGPADKETRGLLRASSEDPLARQALRDRREETGPQVPARVSPPPPPPTANGQAPDDGIPF